MPQLAPLAKQQFFDANGNVLASGKLYTYLTATSTPKTTYSDNAATPTANANPIILDSRGECSIWLDSDAAYRFTLKDSSDVTIWTKDDITPTLNGTPVVVSTIAALKALTGGAYPTVQVMGYFSSGDGGGGLFRWNSADSTSDNGGTVIAPNSGSGRWNRVWDGSINVKWFGCKGDGVQDDTTYLQAVRDYVNGQTYPPRVVFPSGIYKYSTSPNWAIQDAEFVALGEVRLRYTGTANAVTLDGGAAGTGVYNVRMKKFIVEAPNTAQNAVYCRAFHHGDVAFKVLGAGTAYSGLRTEWCVCSQFDITVSVNEEGWYSSAKPQEGLYLSRRGAGENTAFCNFVNPIAEGTTTGCVCDYTTGNSFFGGTFEACTSQGLNCTSNSTDNKFYDVDFEANTVRDIYDQGTSNHFIGCETTKLITVEATARDSVIFGGRHAQITVIALAEATTISTLRLNRNNDGSTVTDGGTRTRMRDIVNLNGNVQQNTILARTALTVGASPYTYQNLSGAEECVYVVGGTLTSIGFARLGVTDTGFTAGMFTLSPNDSLVVTYTVVPTMIKLTR